MDKSARFSRTIDAKIKISVATTILAGTSLTAIDALAQQTTLSCTNSGYCLSATIETTGANPVGIVGSSVPQGTGGGVGVEGYVDGTAGSGLAGWVGTGGFNPFGPDTAGVYGASNSGLGVLGTTTSSTNTANGVVGLYGSATLGSTGSNSGVYGASSSDNGVFGTITGSAAGAAISGIDATTSGNKYGVFGDSPGGYGVYGGTSSGYGLAGVASSGLGVYGSTQSGPYGIAGYNESSSSSAIGLLGEAPNGWGVYANSINTSGKYYINGVCQVGCSSDLRLKKNVQPMKDALSLLLQLKGVTYEWKNPEEKGENTIGIQQGFIAQDVEKVFPQWVGEDNRGLKTLLIRTPQIAALEVESIRTLKAENDELRDRVKALETGRRPIVSGFGDGEIGLGLLAIAAAVGWSRRRRVESHG
jgi:hypothetical protein